MKNSFQQLRNFAWAKIFVIFSSLSFLLRSGFLFLERKEIDFSALLLAKIYLVGLFFDLLALGYIVFIPLLYYTFVPTNFFNRKSHQKFLKILYFIFLYVIIFSIVSEIVFWDEFQTRFNFIAVDYLIYTTEVIENIVESYPLIPILSLILAVAAAIFCFSEKNILLTKTEKFSNKFKNFVIFSIFLLGAFFSIDSSKITRISNNNYANQIAANGIYQLFSAYFNNDLVYDELYATKDIKDSVKTLKTLISKQEPRSKFLNDEDLSRFIPQPNSGEEKRYNVIFVAVESLSAEFMQAFGSKENVTPNLDSLAKKSLFFTNLKATGTRTVRGLEALSLSIPPTPGNSIVRRSNNENLFNIASPLKDRGYDARFIYGGAGYFDNMNYFFENNGFKIVDINNFSKEEVSFKNAWGVADEDLFDKAIKEADKSYSGGKPFFNFIMTTSNHRPFTYPAGKIDIDPKTGRNGAVKYSDYAIGQLIEKAKKKKWFDNTIFVIIADHCAGSAGNTDVPLWRYQIPAIIYAPKIIKPRVFDKNVSQIDIAPTLLGIMNLSYKSKFFGLDVLTNEKTIDQHSFVSTYVDVGYFKNDKLFLLKPKKEQKVFDVKINKYGWNGSEEKEIKDGNNQKELDETISYYQAASYLFKNGKLKNFTTDKRN